MEEDGIIHFQGKPWNDDRVIILWVQNKDIMGVPTVAQWVKNLTAAAPVTAEGWA